MIQYAKSIQIWGDGNSIYENDIKKLLDNQIQSNAVGGLVLKALADANDAKHTVLTIQQFTDKDAAEHNDNHCNAVTQAGIEDDAHQERDAYYIGNYADKTRYDMSSSFGTGRGTNSNLHFTPGSWGPGLRCTKGAISALPDEVLLHEMVHGLRDMLGRTDMFPTERSQRGYEHGEEFLAIVVTNIFMSVKGTTILRGARDAHIPLPDSLSTSAGFLTDFPNVWLLSRLFSQEPRLFLDLALVVARFNPIRELVTDVSKYQMLGQELGRQQFMGG